MTANTQIKERTRRNSQQGRVWFRKAKVIYYRISKRRGLSVLLIGILAFIVSASLSLLVRMPQPAIHDEFSYLLAADTFSHGRLTNPTHPMWVHFESFHIIHQPTYASKFQPGQGLLLAAGQVIAGHPIVGAWLGTALGCAAICWMLFAWVPPRWAIIGGLITVFHPMFVIWGQSYWGGALAMSGGALILGSARRIAEYLQTRNSWLFGMGMMVLALTRPYEGAVLSILAGAYLLWRIPRGAAYKQLLLRIGVPIVVMFSLTFIMMGYYNHRVTSSVLKMPYMVHEETYGISPLFIFQSTRPEPVYRHKELRDFHAEWELNSHNSHQSISGLASLWALKLGLLFVSYFSFVTYVSAYSMIPLLLIGIPLSAPPLFRTDRKLRDASVIFFVFFVAVLLIPWPNNRYLAPVACLFFIFVLEFARRLNSVEIAGFKLGCVIIRACAAMCIVSFIAVCVIIAVKGEEHAWRWERAHIIDVLKKDGERHLVIVRYAIDHSAHEEWVYNEADIDNARVVWAREMDEAQNRKLLEYFNNSRVWLLEADAEHPELVPYNGQR